MERPDSRSPENLAALFKKLGDIRHDFRNKNLYAFLLARLKPGSLLDIGCGAGHFLHLAQKAGHPITGIEPNEGLIALAEKLYGKLDIRKLAVEDLSAIDERYNNITVIDVLEHIEKDEELLKRLKNLLAANGRLHILVPCYQHLYGKRDQTLGHYRRYEKTDLVSKLRRTGYEVRESRYWNMLGYGPYWFAEKLLKREISVALRTQRKKNFVQKSLSRVLDLWFRIVENRLNLGFGLSFYCSASPARVP
ncbi:MAG: class I SAM-dependent methyltransferase [Candidatus Omnitrophota bacterium]